mmetsp:Transcript_20067/g.29165  ORF Transcript_20067/g.29165 Transcript_20067/m.29165 type:complete len:419 (-) Transcript_20067:112-1368(-)
MLRGAFQRSGGLLRHMFGRSSSTLAESMVRAGAVVSVPNDPGALRDLLRSIDRVNLTRIESIPLADDTQQIANIHLEFCAGTKEPVNSTLENLRKSPSTVALAGVPWFPRTQKDLERIKGQTVQFGEELDADHPGFLDKEYRKRRSQIAQADKSYRLGMKIPKVNYVQSETSTWKTIYETMEPLRNKYACREFLYAFSAMEAAGIMRADHIPQLQTLNDYLNDRTGWRIRPVSGLVSPRNFLNALAVRVFHSTQYIRHHDQPLYTPEPDICHEVLGHIPMLCDPGFAAFSQEIGLASLGASDDDIERLARCYWFTVEFGLCRQDGEVKAYGAGVLSSYGEIEHAFMGSEARTFVDWDPMVASQTDYPITKYQPLYFVANNFTSARNKLVAFTSNEIKRPFGTVFNEERNEVSLTWQGR